MGDDHERRTEETWLSTLPAVSLVTPVWNARAYLAETISSVCAQLRPGDDYIVIDDGSTDGSGQLLDELARSGSFRLIRQPNGGEIAAVNAAVSQARHDLVCIVNAEDPILPGLVETMRAAFSNDPELVAAYPDWLKIDHAGRTIATVRTADYSYAVLLAEHFCIPGPGAFFRRSAIAPELVRDPAAAGLSDYDFWVRLGRDGAHMVRIPTVLATWRLHDQGSTLNAHGPRLAAARVALADRFFARSDLSPETRALERRARSAACYHAALTGLRARGVPAWRYALWSFALLPVWPATVTPSQRRSWPHLAYAIAQPVSGWLHRMLDPFLPAPLRRARVLSQTFRLDV